MTGRGIRLVVSSAVALGVVLLSGMPANADDSDDVDLTISVVAPAAPAGPTRPAVPTAHPVTGADPSVALASAALLLALGGLAIRFSTRSRRTG